MAKKTTEELTQALSELLGDRMTEDAAIALAEDIADSVGTTADDAEDWKAKYNELDKSWRERYTKRFYSRGEDEIEEDKTEKVEEKDEEDLTVDDLFEVKERK